MRRAIAALVVTTVVVILLARFETHPPRTLNRETALEAHATPRALAREQPARPAGGARGRRTTSATGPAYATPFSVIQVRATLTGKKLTGVETVALSGDGPHTEALNARAEPLLRAAALRAGSADIDVVSGATSTSKIWIDSLEGAIERARRRQARGDR